MVLGAVFLFGLIWGSFLNVCIHRIPLHESVVFPSSHCPSCNAALAWHDNIPVLSYVMLAGKCRDCQARISFRYPLVEVLTATLFVIAYQKAASTSAFIASSIFLSFIIPLIFIDYYHYILPNVLTLPGIFIGFLLSPLQPMSQWNDFLTRFVSDMVWLPGNAAITKAMVGSLLGIVLGGGILWFVRAVYLLIRKVEGLGFGDIKMMAMAGAFLGWRLCWLTIFVASAVGSLYGVYLMLAKGKNLKYAIYFGTFLGIGAIISQFYGDEFLNWYFSAHRR